MKKRFLKTLEVSIKMMVIWEQTGLKPYHKLWLQNRDKFVKAQKDAKGVTITGEEMIEALENGKRAGEKIANAYSDYSFFLATMDEEEYDDWKAENQAEIKMWERFEAGSLKGVE